MILISQLVYEPIQWLTALIDNKEKFTSNQTSLCFHLNSESKYSEYEMRLLKSRMVLINPERIRVRAGDGSILMGHLSNFKFVSKFQTFSHIIFASSNMFWIRKDIETYVYKYNHSVGLEGVRNGNLHAPRYMRNSTIYKILSKNYSKELWSYHEGTFYPTTIVTNFRIFLETFFSRIEVMEHKYFPEEFWLPTYMLNYEKSHYHKISRPLCWRIPGPKSNPYDSIVTHKIIDNLSCRYYAIKRVLRNLSFSPTLRLQNMSSKRCQTKIFREIDDKRNITLVTGKRLDAVTSF